MSLTNSRGRRGRVTKVKRNAAAEQLLTEAKQADELELADLIGRIRLEDEWAKRTTALELLTLLGAVREIDLAIREHRFSMLGAKALIATSNTIGRVLERANMDGIVKRAKVAL